MKGMKFLIFERRRPGVPLMKEAGMHILLVSLVLNRVLLGGYSQKHDHLNLALEFAPRPYFKTRWPCDRAKMSG